VVTAINYFAVKAVGRLQIVLTALKVIGLAAIVILGLVPGRVITLEPAASLSAPPHPSIEAFLTALVPVMLAYNGFQWLGNVGGEIVNPRTNLPRAAILGTALVITLYVLTNWIYFHILGLSAVAQSQHVASGVLTVLLGVWGG